MGTGMLGFNLCCCLLRIPTSGLLAQARVDSSLDLRLAAGVFQLLLRGFGIGLRDAFLDRLRRTVDQVLRFLEAEARQLANSLDHVDLVVTDRRQHDSELGLLFDSRRGGACSGCGNGDGGGCGDAELVFHRLDELGELEDGHRRDLVEDFGLDCGHFSCSWTFRLMDWNQADGAASLLSRNAATVRTNFDGTSFRVRTNFAIGACIVATSLPSSSSREGSEASAATSFADITWPGIAPARITNFSWVLAKSLRTFATATGSVPMPYASGPDILSASAANGVSATARRTSVFLTTRK